MKFCLSARQPDQVLKKADEIKIKLRDFRAIPEYMEKFPNKTLILELENELPDDFLWNDIQMYADAHKDFYCAISNKSQGQNCSSRGIKFYYKYATTNFYELTGLKEMGVSYVLIAEPLIFDLPAVKAFGIPIRAIPNLAYEPYINRKDGLVGGWIRPEDIDIYSKYIDTLEFYAPKGIDHEAALFRIYGEKKTWPDNLNRLIEHLNIDIENVVIDDEFAKMRIKCGQKCVSRHTCSYCYKYVNYIQSIKQYAAKKDLN